MREVVINSRIRYQGLSGTATALDEIEKALGGDAELSVTTLQGPAPIAGHGKIGRVLRLLQSVWWDGWAFGRLTKSDVAICPAAVGGWASRAKTNILVIHDLMVFDKRLNFDRGFRLLSTVTWPASVRSADIILTPSESTRTEVVTRWPHAEPKVTVLPWPCRLKPRTGEPKCWDLTGRPTVIMVSATEPHKDHLRGIEVVQMARSISGVDFALAIIGPRRRAEAAVLECIETCDPRGTWISRLVDLDHEQLIGWLDDGFALLNTSKGEGFGLPLLEAAACDLPVVHSRAGSMNEVIPLGGDESVTTLSLAEELVSLLDAEAYRAAVERGRNAVKDHSAERFSGKIVQLVTRKY